MKQRYRYFLTLLIGMSASCAADMRIASINLCTDQLLYLLEEKQNIASVSYLSVDNDYSYLAEEMSGFHINHAKAEEIIPLEPDLVLAGNYSDIQTVHLLRNLGYRVEQVDIPFDIQHIEKSIMQVGILLDRKENARSIIEEMRKRSSIARNKVLNKSRPLAIIIGPDGYTQGRNSMAGDLLELAGYRNLAAEAGITGSGHIDLETLIKAEPDYLIIEDTATRKNSMAQRFLDHPALSDGLPKMKRINIDPNLWTCGGPAIIDALEILVEAHP